MKDADYDRTHDGTKRRLRLSLEGHPSGIFRSMEHGAGSRGLDAMSEDSRTKGKLFRFQDLEIWKKAIEIGNKLLDIADDLEKRRLYRFAEQTRGASLSISNNTCPVK